MQRRMLHLRLHAQHFVLSLLPCRRIEGVSDDERQQKVDAQQDCACCGAMVELLLAECAEKSSERRRNVIQSAYVQTYVQLAEKIDLRCMHDDDLQQISHTCPTQDQHGLLACLLPEYSTRSKGEP